MNKSRHSLGCFGILLSLLTVASSPGYEEGVTKRAPNLIIVLTDDQGYADVGFNGCKDIPTPNIDRIAGEGVRFTNGYVSFAVCGPSRAGLMTGRYQDRFGSCLNPTLDPGNAKAGVPLSEKNLAEVLGPVGYKCMAVGKWHMGTHPTLRPLVRGFDEFFGFLSGGHRYFPEELTLQDFSEVKKHGEWYRTKILRNEERIEIKEYLTDELSNAAVDFIDRRKDEPFFLYLAYNAPHSPLQATDTYLDRFKHIENEKRRTYAAMVSAVDDGVGKVLAKLAEHNLNNDTLIVFLSDNGGPVSNGSSNAPLRGEKGTPFEGGIRVPFAMRWTGTLPEGVDYDQPVISLDIFATIVAQAGAPVSKERPLDGVNLMPYLTGKNNRPPHDQLFWRFHAKETLVIRRATDKLIRKIGDHIDGNLFDLSNDISESNDVAAQKQSLAQELAHQAEEWAKDLKPPAYPGLGTWLKK